MYVCMYVYIYMYNTYIHTYTYTYTYICRRCVRATPSSAMSATACSRMLTYAHVC